MTPENFFEKGVWPGSRDSVNFWALNANSSKMSTCTNFQFGKHAFKGSLVMTPEKFFRKGGVDSVMWPRKLWALNANSPKMSKDTNFKFGRHAPMDSVSSDKARIENWI